MMASPTAPRTMHSFDQTPCIALRRSKTPEALDITSPRGLDFVPRLRTSSSSSLNKLTGSPGYVTIGGCSPTKVHPQKPHHVRGGSISSDISDVSNVDQIIPIQPCDSQMLVPLLHRHLEMKELIANNTAHFSRLRSALGTELFEKCTSLWTETTRAELNDLEWLKQTQRLIKGQDNWVLWCEIVGWDNNELLLDRTSASAPQMSETISAGSDSRMIDACSRQSSVTDLQKDTITEEPEE